ncbi:hypothetical protein ACP70R_018176 [Stipagrostis hirtigluma subsp. patula]
MDAAADGAASPRTFAVLARSYVAAGMTLQAVRAFDDMEAFVGREPDGGEFATLLDTLCKYKYPKGHVSLHPDNRFDRTVRAAEDLLKEMRDREFSRM